VVKKTINMNRIYKTCGAPLKDKTDKSWAQKNEKRYKLKAWKMYSIK
jgi:hypothetical protein